MISTASRSRWSLDRMCVGRQDRRRCGARLSQRARSSCVHLARRSSPMRAPTRGAPARRAPSSSRSRSRCTNLATPPSASRARRPPGGVWRAHDWASSSSRRRSPRSSSTTPTGWLPALGRAARLQRRVGDRAHVDPRVPLVEFVFVKGQADGATTPCSPTTSTRRAAARPVGRVGGQVSHACASATSATPRRVELVDGAARPRTSPRRRRRRRRRLGAAASVRLPPLGSLAAGAPAARRREEPAPAAAAAAAERRRRR